MKRHHRALVVVLWGLLNCALVTNSAAQDPPAGEKDRKTDSQQGVSKIGPTDFPLDVIAVPKKKKGGSVEDPQPENAAKQAGKPSGQELPPLAPRGGSASNRPSGAPPPDAGGSGAPSPARVLIDRVVERKLGGEKFRLLTETIERTGAAFTPGEFAPAVFGFPYDRGSGLDNPDASKANLKPGGLTITPGSPWPSTVYDKARPGIGTDVVPVSSYKRATVEDAQEVKRAHGEIPGGIILEGAAAGLGSLSSLHYDRRFNAFIFDGAVYFLPVPPDAVAVMCKTIDEDPKEEIGVSLGDKELLYGQIPEDSRIAWDLKLADHFLGDIVFAQGEWTRAYRFAQGYDREPDKDQGVDTAVFFNFGGFQFRAQDQELKLVSFKLDIHLFPLSEAKSERGGHLPDMAAIERGQMSKQYENNARHIRDNIAYYGREVIVGRVVSYGEVAAVLRELKHAGFDIAALAKDINGKARR